MKKLLFLLLVFLWGFAKEPDIFLLQTYKDQNVSGWLMSEKLDGVRAIWDGKILKTRTGHTIHAPKWFFKDFPPFELDGELWSKRGEFEKILSIVMDEKPTQGWKEITYNIFEVPNQRGGLLQRLELVKPFENEFLRLIEQITIKNNEHMLSYYKELIEKGAEGIVIRNPNATYETGRTHNALKKKEFQTSECIVKAYHEGKGKYASLVGSLECEMQNGVRFKIGSGLSDAQRINPPKIGALITIKHQGFTNNNKPRFPVFLRCRQKDCFEKR